MAVKEWFRRLQPVQLYIVLFFTIAFFAVELIASYVTHALTLLMNAYHMLCNIVALVGCIATIKYERQQAQSRESSSNSLKASSNAPEESAVIQQTAKKSKQTSSEKRMKNTFGWARIDIVTMLICCVLLASFCFSLMVEALQTLVHIDHLDEMHHPLPIMTIGASGILLNAFCYFLIGGYTFNQGVFLHFTKNGEIVLKRTLSLQTSKEGNNSDQTRRSPITLPRSQGVREMCRDVLGCFLVMIASCVVYFTDRQIAKYVDPIFAMISAISLFVLSYPYMKESGMILLQTIPNHINIDSLQKELLAAFPDIMNVHDLHVWQLNGEKVVSTVHIIYADATVCARITDEITAFFIEMGITHVTIQPEFCTIAPHVGPNTNCLIRCQSKHCSASTCCSRDELDDHHHHHHHRPIVSKKFGSKEVLPTASSVNLKRFSLNITEVNETSICRAQSVTNLKQLSTSDLTVEVTSKALRQIDDIVISAKSNEELTITECQKKGSHERS
ncbi:proton-coupled zinc antiporter SLC30A1 [Phymastichus coffea]|uniref:proton-coupled zinc antiporter SLC30A1 n=1 Tax=Phymastichus coffea TaxID=108790 RepID=UPI00273CD9E9|nr:proton-coupled zinc antiporter SLC30A1 [Phymastichus coffea]XP_058789247.1 proton-coupled zinc antiporter SLC30A1 [Phymastichus coffea]XP_058789248.1 proton-coupled zinc antiporter SLC30A1 [Phymastichus coffea]XP_058789249.1 proton-coupled zinc antiporter SLC30A1 [Phymastichus coffea]XP_058789250.1 proton-coupled zinc antiporter SLC30A1 [Phymastichus coffea]XP_058789251.1 proton-coupled zinc antiporter SLC30A1 [Phymastichus coffea]